MPLTRQPRRRYSSYPLGQIDYTLTYEPILPWDFVAQNAYFNSVQSVFSERELQIGIGIGSYDEEDAQVVAALPPRLRFYNHGSEIEIFLERNQLIVTHKPPYRGWEKLEPSIKLAIDSLHHAIGLKEFKSITARAVNRFALNMKGAALPDFFSCFPSVNRRTFGAWTSSSLSFSFVHRHRSLGTIPITIDLSADPAEQGTDLKITLVLECEFCQVFEYSQYGALLNEIHNLMNDAFESSITDKLREKFGEIK